ncbi:protein DETOXIFICATION 12-like [Nymphaea colorata]|nr:protein DETOXIFICATION 12-like [Nymphaea colorata]
MEESLLGREQEGGYGFLNGSLILREMKKQGMVALPMVVVSFSQYLLQVLSLMMVGHLGKLPLSSAAIASSVAGVMGFSVLLGMASALETLCGQAYGAEQYERLGIYTQRAVVTLLIVCIPLSLILVYIEKILCFVGQDPLVAHEAGSFAIYLIPGLFASALLQPLLKFLQSQSLTLPMLYSSFAGLCFHAPVCWLLIFKFGLGHIGGSLCVRLSYWFSVAILAFYVKLSPSCKRTLASLSKDSFGGFCDFLKLSFPSAAMICLEYWSFELLILLSGLLPNPELETSVLSICLTTLCLLYCIPYGLSAAGSTRVSNELGAGRPREAQLAVLVAIFLAALDAGIVVTTLSCTSYLLGRAYSSEKEVILYVAKMIPLLSLSSCMDALQGVLSGVARGCGWQQLGAYINLGAFYLFGIPLAALLAFSFHLGARGLWIGIVCGSVLQTILLCLITCFTDWQVEVNRARERILEKPT